MVKKLVSWFSLAIFFSPTVSWCQSDPVEAFLLQWPAEDHWQVVHHNWDATGLDLTLVKEGESLEEWSEIASSTFYKGYYQQGVEQIMGGMIRNAQKTYLKAKMTIVERHTGWDEKYPWVLFMIECEDYNRTGKPQSVMYLIRKGEHYTYIAFRAIRAAKISGKVQKNWEQFFTAGQVVEMDWTTCLESSKIEGLDFLERGN